MCKQGILRCFPDLGGRLTQLNMLSKESTMEQRSAELHRLSKEEFDYINAANSKYQTKFNFPFVLCALENKKATIFEELQRRVDNSPNVELHTGIEEAKKICYHRLLNLVQVSLEPKL
ncbi:2-oxo-4-hydroxy-4-carboxy-5-ureidoimidazoline decarboxylase-like [Oratosquilla oratoria]|uniref:2-oxo-4-hydroxy-4-carboxy-5-ureidoimidazoline decarboxylase-like n=1 Tax=Oratosquilla oratoria TaxID=337810 RepID=UPI003F765B6D